jgi:hypothetical protein
MAAGPCRGGGVFSIHTLPRVECHFTLLLLLLRGGRGQGEGRLNGENMRGGGRGEVSLPSIPTGTWMSGGATFSNTSPIKMKYDGDMDTLGRNQ